MYFAVINMLASWTKYSKHQTKQRHTKPVLEPSHPDRANDHTATMANLFLVVGGGATDETGHKLHQRIKDILIGIFLEVSGFLQRTPQGFHEVLGMYRQLTWEGGLSNDAIQ